MTLPVVWLAEAVAELQQALAHYDAIRPELGTRFLLAADQTLGAISAQPLRFAIVDKDRRRAGVRRFPYGIFFLVEENRVVVIACFHGKRHPRLWQER